MSKPIEHTAPTVNPNIMDGLWMRWMQGYRLLILSSIPLFCKVSVVDKIAEEIVVAEERWAVSAPSSPF